ncbi:opacity protein-like surface antigen [Bradyrhizobium barranii subsp. barranii]
MSRLAVIGVGLVSILGFTSAVSAADLAVKAPVATKQFSWTGCFIGVHAGGDFSYDKIRSSGDFSSTGFIGGGQIGCDYQFASLWVVGVEGRAAWSSLTSKTPGLGNFGGVIIPTQFTVSNDFLASATVRLGYSFAGNWLAYGRGGVAWTRERPTTLSRLRFLDSRSIPRRPRRALAGPPASVSIGHSRRTGRRTLRTTTMISAPTISF